ncbi:MAG TPA: hypothetical protein VGS58_03515 [Candidatus Sulfopaludibacter sp.]|nr:hypothetical protein [Candidatus Sulfopaludibacter sp.]
MSTHHGLSRTAPVFVTWRLRGGNGLQDPRVVNCVVKTLLRGEKEWRLYFLFAWVAMDDHIHALLLPHAPVAEIAYAIRTTSAREANRILGRAGLPFWADESSDHWVRDAEEFAMISEEIERHPVNAGLVDDPGEWPWSSAAESRAPGSLKGVTRKA